MKNIEKYYDVLLEKQNFFCYIHNEIMKKNTCGNISCFDWLIQEYKEPIKLTEDEKVILRNLPKKYKWIARDENNNLYLYVDNPCKIGDGWGSDEFDFFKVYNNLFKFIKWEDEEPYSIEELLKE